VQNVHSNSSNQTCVFTLYRGRSYNKYFPLFSSVLQYDYGHYLGTDSDHSLFYEAQSKFHEKLTTVCPTLYRTRHFFNNSNTNEDIATKYEQEYVRCVRNEKECVCSVCVRSAPNCCDTEQLSASQPGSVGSGTHCIHVLRKRCSVDH